MHWILLIVSALFIFIAIPFRIFRNRKIKTVVFFYQMHGNSRALADYICKYDKSIRMYFLAFPGYLEIYKGKQNLPTLNMLNLKDMIRVAQSDVIVTNYEALTLLYLAKLTDIKFVDVWHGLPMLKNQTPKILNYLNSYEEIWVSSNIMKEFYLNRYQLKSKIVSTGYGRVDNLINGSFKDVKKRYSIPDKKVIMIAPTWKQNDPSRSDLPFGMSQDELLSHLNEFAKSTNSFIIFRAHMLSDGSLNNVSEHIRSMPTRDYPDTEELLSITDILVTDWSSLVFDFLVLDRPVIFININAPFQGDDLRRRSTPENRFSDIIDDFESFEKIIKSYLKNPNKYLKKNSDSIIKVKEIAYGNTADGRSTERYYKRLKSLLGN